MSPNQPVGGYTLPVRSRFPSRSAISPLCSAPEALINSPRCRYAARPYAPRNMGELWIDPIDYQQALEQSVDVLTRFGIETRIYNLQLCVLPRSLWKFAKQSISDWKNTYSGDCQDCAVKSQCGGFFHWNTKVQSRGIRPIAHEQPFAEIGFPSVQR
jgi:hypothetical protein